ncbi:hypothetical protein P153DRAFT_403619 [Dothidotthia symphoricarpi CBS 119687]|uniref:Uncharacterized protein n=1 Tax=Dothidotthia symphoricarpi CBS 119687 TaxID=1392245 RepID=A0A6A6AC77_9PLEO|nr:uncharacterized protein P153DRAFT_403619 [Dothidotthia symphoricarpi CBS 119687]KAF2128745.1 hypothetical protein P153DRAFT_403619 [Dothidotthia symphoricarpi CBS 119687]
MSDDWLSCKLAPDGDFEDGCHHEQADALKNYLHLKMIAKEAPQAVTRPVVVSENPRDELSRPYILLLDALVELPSEHIEPLLALKGLPHFGNLWSDVGYRSGSWKRDAEATAAPESNALLYKHVRRAETEARLVEVYDVIEDASESDGALLDLEVPAAAEWFGVYGQWFRPGTETGKKIYAHLDEVMSWKKWSLWEERLKKLQAQSGIVHCAVTKRLMPCMRETKKSHEC